MGNEWKEKLLIDEVNVTMGQSPSSKFYNKEEHGMPFMQGRTTFGDKYHLIDTWTTEVKRQASKNSVLMSVRAPVGDINIATKDLCIGRGLASLEMKNGNNEFLYYLLKANQNQIINKETGTVFGSINKSGIENLKLKFPPLPIQKKIAEILSSLDDKIELNNQMNKTLEEMAQAIFKQWFVDFEFPNDNGEPYKSSGGEMVESELGLIPKGWEVKELGDFLNIKHGYAFKGKEFSDVETELIVLSPGNFKIGGGFKSDKYKYLGKNVDFPNEYIFKENDLMVTMTDLSKSGDTLGYPAFIPKMKDLKFLHNQRLGKLELKDKNIGKNFFYFLMCTREYRGTILGSATGSTVKHTAPKRIQAHKFVWSELNSDIYIKFEEVISIIMKRIKTNEYETIKLLETRDTLLPKLINGEIDVNEVEI